MLTVAQIDLPMNTKKRLQEEAAFADSFSSFTRENIIGFRQPVAMAVSLILPVMGAFVYSVGGLASISQIAVPFGLSTTCFLLGGWYVNRRAIRDAYIRRTRARRDAKANLRAGVGEHTKLDLKHTPIFYEHEHGVICLADSGDGRTIYFDVDSLEQDPRWFLYINGDMHRSLWTWIRLMGSGTVSNFEARGQRLAKIGDTPYVEAPDAWEAISIALNEPQDGDVIDQPLSDVQDTISRLI